MQIVGIDKSGANKFNKEKFCHRNEIHTVFFFRMEVYFTKQSPDRHTNNILCTARFLRLLQVITRTKIILKFTTLKIRLPPFNIILLYKIFLFQFLFVILLKHFTIFPRPTFPKPLLLSLFKIHNLFFIC